MDFDFGVMDDMPPSPPCYAPASPALLSTSHHAATPDLPSHLLPHLLSPPHPPPLPSLSSSLSPPLHSSWPAAEQILLPPQSPPYSCMSRAPSKRPAPPPLPTSTPMPKPMSMPMSMPMPMSMSMSMSTPMPTPAPSQTQTQSQTQIQTQTQTQTQSVMPTTPATPATTAASTADTAATAAAVSFSVQDAARLGGLRYAVHCKERAREAFKAARRAEHFRRGDTERVIRKRRGDGSLSEGARHARRLGMNQDSAAASRHAQDVYVDVLQRLVGACDFDAVNAAATLRTENTALKARVRALAERVRRLEEAERAAAVADASLADAKEGDSVLVSRLIEALYPMAAVGSQADKGFQPTRAV